jgi:hypothetical protein
MVVLLPVLAGVPILRVVATANHTTDKAGAEMNPGVARGDATFANVRPGLGQRLQTSEMKTGSR